MKNITLDPNKHLQAGLAAAVQRYGDDQPDATARWSDDPAVRVFACVHAAVGLARDFGRSRVQIAASLGRSEHWLNTLLSARGDMEIRLADFAQMLFNPGVLGTEAHAWLFAQVGDMLADRRHGVPSERLVHQAAEAGRAMGELFGEICAATDHDSEDGPAISMGEAAVIDEARAIVLVEVAAVRMDGDR